MTRDEEIAFHKGKRAAMEFFSIWLKEHAMTSRGAIEDNIPAERVLHRTLQSLEFLAHCLDEKVNSAAKLITEPEDAVPS